MTSIILSAATRFLTPVLVVISVFMLLRGHNAPGGGFVGGLAVGVALALIGLANGPQAIRKTVRLEPRVWLGIGLLLAIGAGLVPAANGQPFLTGVWGSVPTPFGELKLGTPMLFDLGVYCVVIGVVSGILSDLGEA